MVMGNAIMPFQRRTQQSAIGIYAGASVSSVRFGPILPRYHWLARLISTAMGSQTSCFTRPPLGRQQSGISQTILIAALRPPLSAVGAGAQ